MKAKRITPCEQQLPAMPPPTMPPLFVVVAWNRQRKWWMIAGKSKHAFTGERLAKMLPRTHWLHGRVYELSDNET